MTQEEARLAADRARTAYWKRWGPYLSERQWGTVLVQPEIEAQLSLVTLQTNNFTKEISS